MQLTKDQRSLEHSGVSLEYILPPFPINLTGEGNEDAFFIHTFTKLRMRTRGSLLGSEPTSTQGPLMVVLPCLSDDTDTWLETMNS